MFVPASLATRRMSEIISSFATAPLTRSSRNFGSFIRVLFAVGDPDVFDLGGVLEEEAVGGGGGVEPVDLAAFVGEGLFEVADGKSFCGGAGGGVGEGPEGVEVIVFG